MSSVNNNPSARPSRTPSRATPPPSRRSIDAQKAGNASQDATTLREAVHHMPDTADVLAAATVKQFPEEFSA
jgi:hypothetical protein